MKRLSDELKDAEGGKLLFQAREGADMLAKCYEAYLKTGENKISREYTEFLRCAGRVLGYDFINITDQIGTAFLAYPEMILELISARGTLNIHEVTKDGKLLDVMTKIYLKLVDLGEADESLLIATEATQLATYYKAFRDSDLGSGILKSYPYDLQWMETLSYANQNKECIDFISYGKKLLGSKMFSDIIYNMGSSFFAHTGINMQFIAAGDGYGEVMMKIYEEFAHLGEAGDSLMAIRFEAMYNGPQKLYY